MQARLWLTLAGVGLALNGPPACGDEKKAPPLPRAVGAGGYVLVRSSESRARAARLLPLKGSEDARYLLVRPTLPRPPAASARKTHDIVPDADIDWVIDVFLPNGAPLTTEQIDAAFSRERLRQMGADQLYGFSVEEQRWDFVHIRKIPTRWTRLAVAKELLATYRDNPQPESEASLLQFFESVRAGAARLHVTEMRARTKPAMAADRARSYFECWKAAGREAVVALQATRGSTFEGRKIWDVMYSLGLEWGDGDLFNWLDSPEGGDSLFSVSTTTQPGYFFPEQIAAGTVRTNDLVFSFSIPRDLAPDATLTEMLKAARYAQKRLGGVLLNAEGRPFDEQAERAAIAGVVAHLRQAGLQPGTAAALRIF